MTKVVKPAFTHIQGGRAIEAKRVTEIFNQCTLELLLESGPIAGFFMVTIDDEGHIITSSYAGKRMPYSRPMLCEAVKQRVDDDIRSQP